jgi:hypothetical protein
MRLDALAQARADGFRVAEDLSVTDPHGRRGSREEHAAWQVLAHDYAARGEESRGPFLALGICRI